MRTYDELGALLARMTGDAKHDPSALSTLDVVWTLYDRVLRVHGPDRDRFYLSKGHGPAAYYAVLAAKELLPAELLAGWTSWDSPLGMHPDRVRAPGVEISSGSLGHGLALGVGTALGLRAQGSSARTVVLVGDAELDEGSNHEAVALAARFSLDRLTAVVVENDSATLGWPGGIASRFAVEGWQTADVDGHDHDALEKAFAPPAGAPLAVVAHVAPKAAA